jgi:hypothetical protein
VIPVGPISLTLDTPVTEVDPAQTLGNSSANVQIQNSSAFVLNVLSGGDVYTIQPFFATTIPVTGAPIVITPTQNPQNTSGNTITIVWLLAGEQPPQEDGPLNLPLSTVEQLINAGLNTMVGSERFGSGVTVLVAPVPGMQVILGTAFLYSGSETNPGDIGASEIRITIGGVSKSLVRALCTSTSWSDVPIAYPQGVACDVDTAVEVNASFTDVYDQGLAVVTYALAS